MPIDFDPFEALGIPSSGEIYPYDLVDVTGVEGMIFSLPQIQDPPLIRGWGPVLLP